MLLARRLFAPGLSIRAITSALLILLLATVVSAQQLTVRHLAGPDGGFGGEDGQGTDARFYNPTGIAADPSGNLFVIDRDNHTLRKITPSGEVRTLVGMPRYGGSQDGVRAKGGLAVPYDLALDAAGTMYVTEVGWDRVKKVTPDGIVSVLAGSGAYPGGSTNGQGTAAQFNDPHGIAVAADGTIYVADSGNHTIRKITPGGLVSTLAGLAGSPSMLDGTGSAARFRAPEDIAIAANGDLYVSDSGNYRIRKVTPAGVVTTVAGSSSSGLIDATGTAARFITPRGLAFDANGVLWIADNSYIRKMTPAGAVTTVAGSAVSIAPSQITVMSGGDLYFTDLVDHTVRRMTQAGAVTLMYGKPAPAGHVDATGTSARFQLSEAGAAMGPDGNLYVGDGPTIRKITPAGVVTTFAGSTYGSNDGTLATAKFWAPIAALTFDPSGVLWVADSGNRTIRRIGTDGQVTTYAGLTGASGTTDGVGSAARFDNPRGIAVDALGNLYVSEYVKHTIRKIAPGGVVTTFAGTAGSSGMVDATGTAARFYQPGNLTIDPSGNLYVADQANYRIRRITPGGVVTTFAGGATGSAWDGTGTAARFGFPYGLTFTSDGNLWVMDSSAVRRITPAREVTTVAGRRGDSYDNGLGSTDGTGSVARFYSPTAIAAGSDGTLYIADNSNNCIRSARPASGEMATIDAPSGLAGQVRQLDAVGGNATSYQWTIVRRPANSTATLSDPAARNPVFVPDVADVYRFRLTATGPDGMSVTEVDLTATCENGAPVVTSTANPSCVGQTVTLDAGPGSAWLWSTGETTRTINVTLTQTQWYSGTVWDANGCATSFSHGQGVQSDLVTANVYAVYTCYGTPATMHVDTLVSGGIKTYDWSWSVNSTGPWTPIPNATGEEFAIDYSYFSPGTYYVKCTVTPSCGTPKTGQSTLSIYSLPSSTITASGPTRFCQGGSVTLTAPSSAQYQWSNGATTRSITVAASGTFTVRTYNNICWSNPSAPVTVTVDPAAATPVITASGPTTFCQGGSVTLTASSGASYLWSNGATTQSTTIQAGGSYTVTVTDANGCSAISAPATVTVQPLPSAVVTASGPLSFCDGGSVTLTAAEGAAWLWSNGATTQSITVTDSGSYSVTITGANGCSVTSSPTIVTVHTAPSVTITPSGPTTFCEGGSVTLTASSSASYLWSNGATTQSIVAAVAGSYSVTVTDANGCTAGSEAVAVTVRTAPETPVITASGPTAFCEGGSVTLSAPAGFTYLWSNGATAASITVGTGGSYSVTVTDGNGCSSTSAPTTVTVNAAPTATITAGGPTTFCAGGSVTLTASAGTSYLWSTGATTQSIDVTTAGSYTVTVTNASGCSATSAATMVTVNANPAATITPNGPTTFCTGGSVTLSAPAGNTYLWSTGATTPSINVTTSGSYTVTVTNAAGCSTTSAATTVTVNAKPATPVITAGGPTTFCAGGSVTLTAPAGLTYLWSTGAVTQSISAGAAGSYSVTVTNASGCSSTSAATTVTVNAATSISAQPQSVTIARSTATTLSVTASGTGTLAYQWYKGTSPSTATPVAGATSSSYTTPKLAKGTYTYWVRVTGSCGVANSNTATVSVP